MSMPPPADSGHSSLKPTVNPMTVDRPRSRRAKFLKAGLICGLLLTMVGAALPSLIAGTMKRRVVAHALAGSGARADVAELSLGWFSPTVASGVQIQKDKDGSSMQAEKIEVGKSLLDFVKGSLRGASVTLHDPKFRFFVGGEGRQLSPDSFPEMKTAVRNGSLTVVSAETREPVVEIPHLNFDANVKELSGNARELTIAPGTIVTREKLTPELCDRGLGLIAPMLADAADIDGEVSLHLSSLRMVIKEDGAVMEELKGEIVIHEANATGGSTIADISRVMADVLRRRVPTKVQVLRDSRIAFHYRDGRVFHEGFAFVLPEISNELVLKTTGSVGIDETLDLVLSVNVPKTMTEQYAVLAAFSDKPIEVAIKGSFDKPAVGLPNDSTLAGYIAQRLVPTPDGKPEGLTQAILRLVSGAGDKADPKPTETITGGVLNLIRSLQANTDPKAAAERRLRRQQRLQERRARRRDR